MANAIDEEARKTPGKRQIAMEAFARALRQLPTTIADNAGFDSAELISKVRAAHVEGDFRAGIDVRTGIVGNMELLGITEPMKLKRQVLLSAAEAAEMILRVDDIIRCAPRKRDDGRTFAPCRFVSCALLPILQGSHCLLLCSWCLSLCRWPRSLSALRWGNSTGHHPCAWRVHHHSSAAVKSPRCRWMPPFICLMSRHFPPTPTDNVVVPRAVPAHVNL